jgi:hypothetical protein
LPNPNGSLTQRQQSKLTKLAHDAIDVDWGQAQSVGYDELAERTLELCLCRQPNERQPFRQFHEKMCGPFERRPPTDTNQVLHDHRLVAGCCP